jgi:hypothetical protein
MQRYRGGMVSHRPEIDPDAFQAIVRPFDTFQFDGPLLPNLREIICDNTDNSLGNVYHLISSKLRHFRMYMDGNRTPGPATATMTILSALRAKSPLVEYFSIIDGYSYREALAPCISDAICGLQRLRTFDCSEMALTCEAIFHLASLPNLRVVDIHIQHGRIGIIPYLHSPFPAVQRLALNCDTMTLAIEFVKRLVRSASLRELTLCVVDPPSSVQLGQIFSLLVAHSSHEHLRWIHVLHPDFISFGGESPPELLKADAFEPLLKFTNLVSINIETECSIEELDDALLMTMAKCWPKLRHIALNNDYSYRSPSQCTLRGILHLVEHCPELISLRIAFQASAEISWNGRPGGGVVNANVEELNVGSSPITDPLTVASFLSNVCPGLTSIVAWNNFDPENPVEVENRERWRKAIELFQSFVATKGGIMSIYG